VSKQIMCIDVIMLQVSKSRHFIISRKKLRLPQQNNIVIFRLSI